jgi:hypothetical protein
LRAAWQGVTLRPIPAHFPEQQDLTVTNDHRARGIAYLKLKLAHEI